MENKTLYNVIYICLLDPIFSIEPRIYTKLYDDQNRQVRVGVLGRAEFFAELLPSDVVDPESPRPETSRVGVPYLLPLPLLALPLPLPLPFLFI
jgi:hypothetical protein